MKIKNFWFTQILWAVKFKLDSPPWFTVNEGLQMDNNNNEWAKAKEGFQCLVDFYDVITSQGGGGLSTSKIQITMASLGW